jgi:hypothetical protein
MVALLVGVSTSLFARTEFERGTRMLEAFSRELREAAEERDPTRFPPKEYNRRLSLIEAAFNQEVVSAVSARSRTSAAELQNELRRALSPREPDPNVASVLAYEFSGRSLYVVAYALGVGAIASRSWIGIVGSRGNAKGYEVLAGVEDSLPNRTVAIEPLGSAGQRGLTFLAHGIYWGDPHSHLTVIAYAFDGRALKTLLTRRDLTQGQVKVDGERIELTFLTFAQGPGYPPVPERTEIYRVTSSGIKLERSWEEKPK